MALDHGLQDRRRPRRPPTSAPQSHIRAKPDLLARSVPLDHRGRLPRQAVHLACLPFRLICARDLTHATKVARAETPRNPSPASTRCPPRASPFPYGAHQRAIVTAVIVPARITTCAVDLSWLDNLGTSLLLSSTIAENRTSRMESHFDRFIGIDYSGARTPRASLSGLRIYAADRETLPIEVLPPASPRRYWTRSGIAEWLSERLSEEDRTLVGIDHGFSFPLAYFEKYSLPLDWAAFLADFRHHWPTDQEIYVDFVRDAICGNAKARCGDPRWRRLTEIRAGGAKSVFHFDVPGSVAKSTHAGLPWLLWLRRQAGDRTHFWPFDGWEKPSGRHLIAEVYPALWNRSFAPEDRNQHQHDAYSIAAWLRQAEASGELSKFMTPRLTLAQQQVATIEGWILGVP